MDVVRALIRVHRLKVLSMTHDMVADLDAVAAMHVARLACNVQRLPAIVALDEGDHLRCHAPFVEQAADPQRSLQSKRDLRLHVGELLLIELGSGQRLAELPALEPVSAGAGPPNPRPAPPPPRGAATGPPWAAPPGPHTP